MLNRLVVGRRVWALWGVGFVLTMVVCTGCAGDSGVGSRSPEIDAYLADGVITEGELEQSWKLAEECMRDHGINAVAEYLGREWGLSVPGEFNDMATLDACTRVSVEVMRQYKLGHVPEGAERLEMLESLRACLAPLGIDYVPYDPAAPDDALILRAVEEQLGYDLSVIYDEPPWLDDPGFGAAVKCLGSHELLFPDRFAPIDGG